MCQLDIIKIGKLALRVNLMSVKANGREPKIVLAKFSTLS
jgi:hypothetical protein